MVVFPRPFIHSADGLRRSPLADRVIFPSQRDQPSHSYSHMHAAGMVPGTEAGAPLRLT